MVSQVIIIITFEAQVVSTSVTGSDFKTMARFSDTTQQILKAPCCLVWQDATVSSHFVSSIDQELPFFQEALASLSGKQYFKTIVCIHQRGLLFLIVWSLFLAFGGVELHYVPACAHGYLWLRQSFYLSSIIHLYVLFAQKSLVLEDIGDGRIRTSHTARTTL